MRRLLPSALLIATGLPAATFSGSLVTPGGGALSNATAMLYNANTNLRKQVFTDASGQFSFEGIAPGTYALHIEKRGFTPLYREVAITDSGGLDKDLVMTPLDGQSSTPAANNSKLIRIGGDTQSTKLIKQVPPVYPVDARRNNVQGTVMLEVILTEEGLPRDVRVLTSPSEDFSQSALEAVRQWRYTPTLLNGQPIEVLTVVKVNYSLSQ